jgi:para-aminobenzoate synthetase/4-amino-4-deoxychorismate lyase
MSTNPSALVFDPERREWLAFETPIDCIEASTLDSVAATLRHIDERTRRERLWAVGWVSYEASPAFDPALTVRPDNLFPLVWFGLFKEPTVLSQLPTSEPTVPLVWSSSITKEEYLSSIRSIKERIGKGDTYQVNYTFRLSSIATASPLSLLKEMVSAQAGAYSCLIESDRFSLVSSSPELFFRKEGSTLVSRPMKGTRSRGRTLVEDAATIEDLRGAPKDRAENTMIVDMVRNDLSKIAERSSVHVTSLCEIERYPNVFQMTSEVSAQSTSSLVDTFKALFPPASITGAPKASTMKIIADLESTPRRVYTGTIGVISPHDKMWFNVAIRTALLDRMAGTIEYGIGSGVVWDSSGENEYQECLDKASAITTISCPREVFETILWEPTSPHGFFLLEEHLTRLKESAEYHSYSFDESLARKSLASLHAELRTQILHHRVRLRLSRGGDIITDHHALTSIPHPYKVSLAQEPVHSHDRRLFHKTSERQVYDDAIPSASSSHDVILWNERGEITESRIANIALEIEGTLFTPPISCGLLGGCYRKHLIEKGELLERVLTKDDLRRATRIVFLNSLRRTWDVDLIETF